MRLRSLFGFLIIGTTGLILVGGCVGQNQHSAGSSSKAEGTTTSSISIRISNFDGERINAASDLDRVKVLVDFTLVKTDYPDLDVEGRDANDDPEPRKRAWGREHPRQPAECRLDDDREGAPYPSRSGTTAGLGTADSQSPCAVREYP